MSFIRREGEHTLSSQIFGEPEDVWLTADKPHCHLALTTIRPGVLAGQIPVSPCRHRPMGTDAYRWYPNKGKGLWGWGGAVECKPEEEHTDKWYEINSGCC